MGFDIAPHLKVTGIAASDDWVNRRTRAVNALAGAFRKRNRDSAIDLANEVVVLFADGRKAMPEVLHKEVFAAVRRAAPTYSPSKHADAELGLVCALATIVAVSDATEFSEALPAIAAAIGAGLSYLAPLKDPKLETLRRDAIQALGDYLHRYGESGRRRAGAPAAIPAIPNDGEEPQAFASRIARAASGAIATFNLNAARDREEIDLLWWVINTWSPVLSKPRLGMELTQQGLTAGLEVAALLTYVPTDAHRSLALRGFVGGDSSAEVSLLELVEGLGEALPRLQQVFKSGDEKIARYPRLFPLLFALKVGAGADGKAKLRANGINGSREISVARWCQRALDEGMLLKRLGHPLVMPAPQRV